MTDHAAIWGWREPTIDRDEVNLILRSLMRMRVCSRRSEDWSEETMSRKMSPDERRRQADEWEQQRRVLGERITYNEARIREQRERGERRRMRLRRLTFGLLGG